MLNKGKLVQIIGPVIDVRFEEKLPDIYNALEVYDDNGEKLVAEVHSHNGNNVVRAVAMTGTDGLRYRKTYTGSCGKTDTWKNI